MPQTGLVEDAVRNVWHFALAGGGAVATGNLAALGAAVGAFYNSALVPDQADSLLFGGQPHSVAFATVSELLAGGGDDVMTTTLGTTTFALSAQTSALADLPAELAVCLSFGAAAESAPEEVGLTRPASRRRGRVYLGPWNTSAVIPTPPQEGLPATIKTAMLTRIKDAYVAMLTSINGFAIPVYHCVYSPTDGLFRGVTDCWVDDAWDIVRSRGIEPTYRVSATGLQPLGPV